MKKKKVLTIVLGAILAFILLFPLPLRLSDGGTTEYRAILYCVSHVHSLASGEAAESGKRYNEGTIIEIPGFKVYNSVQ